MMSKQQALEVAQRLDRAMAEIDKVNRIFRNTSADGTLTAEFRAVSECRERVIRNYDLDRDEVNA